MQLFLHLKSSGPNSGTETFQSKKNKTNTNLKPIFLSLRIKHDQKKNLLKYYCAMEVLQVHASLQWISSESIPKKVLIQLKSTFHSVNFYLVQDGLN